MPLILGFNACHGISPLCIIRSQTVLLNAREQTMTEREDC